MKHKYFLILYVCLAIMTLCGCSINTVSYPENNVTTVGDIEQLDLFNKYKSNNISTYIPSNQENSIVTPAPSKSYFEAMFDSSSNTSYSDMYESTPSGFAVQHGLQDIEFNCVTQTIENIYIENNYNSIEVISYTNEDDRYYYGDLEVRYVVKFNSDYWVITTNGEKAYATKDEYGIFGNN